MEMIIEVTSESGLTMDANEIGHKFLSAKYMLENSMANSSRFIHSFNSPTSNLLFESKKFVEIKECWKN